MSVSIARVSINRTVKKVFGRFQVALDVKGNAPVVVFLRDQPSRPGGAGVGVGIGVGVGMVVGVGVSVGAVIGIASEPAQLPIIATRVTKEMAANTFFKCRCIIGRVKYIFVI